MSGQRSPGLLDSFNYAFEGIIHVLRTQRNMRIHFLVAVVDPQMLPLQLANLVRPHEREPELAIVDPLGAQDAAGELDRRGLVDRHPASIVDLDREQDTDYLLRPVPVSSAWAR